MKSLNSTDRSERGPGVEGGEKEKGKTTCTEGTVKNYSQSSNEAGSSNVTEQRGQTACGEGASKGGRRIRRHRTERGRRSGNPFHLVVGTGHEAIGGKGGAKPKGGCCYGVLRQLGGKRKSSILSVASPRCAREGTTCGELEDGTNESGDARREHQKKKFVRGRRGRSMNSIKKGYCQGQGNRGGTEGRKA